MVKAVFVGDSPSKTNTHYSIAFVGAKCFNTLIIWIKAIQPDYYVVMNSDDYWEIRKINRLHEEGFKVIALGQKSSSRLKKYNISHYKMYHPSGLNRKLNNKKDVDNKLRECYRYVRGEC